MELARFEVVELDVPQRTFVCSNHFPQDFPQMVFTQKSPGLLPGVTVTKD